MKKLILALLSLLSWSASAANVNLAWDASPTPGVTYRLYANGTAVTDTAGLTATVYVTAQTDFYVTAILNGLESTPSNHYLYTPPTSPPAPPTNLRAVAITASRIDTSWDASAYSVVLERGTSLNSFTPIATVPPSQSYYINTGLKKNRTYYFRAKSQGGIDYSNIAAATVNPH